MNSSSLKRLYVFICIAQLKRCRTDQWKQEKTQPINSLIFFYAVVKCDLTHRCVLHAGCAF